MSHVRATALPEDVARFAEAEVAAGGFASVEEVIHSAGIEALHRAQRGDFAAKLASLDAALGEGERSGVADDGVFDRVRRRHRVPSGPVSGDVRYTRRAERDLDEIVVYTIET